MRERARERGWRGRTHLSLHVRPPSPAPFPAPLPCPWLPLPVPVPGLVVWGRGREYGSPSKWATAAAVGRSSEESGRIGAAVVAARWGEGGGAVRERTWSSIESH